MNAESPNDITQFMENMDYYFEFNFVVHRRCIPWGQRAKYQGTHRGCRETLRQNYCEYFNFKPQIQHRIQYFYMHEGFRQINVDIRFQMGVSDVMMSLVRILNNVLPDTFFVLDVRNEAQPLQIYHRTVLLPVDIHQSSKTNSKLIEGTLKDKRLICGDFPGTKSLIWSSGSSQNLILRRFGRTRRSRDSTHINYYFEYSKSSQIEFVEVDLPVSARNLQAMCSAMVVTQTTKKPALELDIESDDHLVIIKPTANICGNSWRTDCSRSELELILPLKHSPFLVMNESDARMFASVINSEHPAGMIFGIAEDEKDPTLRPNAPIRRKFYEKISQSRFKSFKI
ncbi:LOW QUALITY PROTEIN: hypothetical protein PHMEG_0004937 [Phytophthora megakarya]|uniref:Uncharacterized protein n=1 Tax=Phytophthora megakarya TaxID=4795 RepID=A0A225WSL9_9STRA|nr:LOW QUALITY PROTEIN: hypothetical protein PHMEG_0004937 [Phytophthora megakarya]